MNPIIHFQSINFTIIYFHSIEKVLQRGRRRRSITLKHNEAQ